MNKDSPLRWMPCRAHFAFCLALLRISRVGLLLLPLSAAMAAPDSTLPPVELHQSLAPLQLRSLQGFKPDPQFRHRVAFPSVSEMDGFTLWQAVRFDNESVYGAGGVSEHDLIFVRLDLRAGGPPSLIPGNWGEGGFRYRNFRGQVWYPHDDFKEPSSIPPEPHLMLAIRGNQIIHTLSPDQVLWRDLKTGKSVSFITGWSFEAVTSSRIKPGWSIPKPGRLFLLPSGRAVFHDPDRLLLFDPQAETTRVLVSRRRLPPANDWDAHGQPGTLYRIDESESGRQIHVHFLVLERAWVTWSFDTETGSGQRREEPVENHFETRLLSTDGAVLALQRPSIRSSDRNNAILSRRTWNGKTWEEEWLYCLDRKLGDPTRSASGRELSWLDRSYLSRAFRDFEISDGTQQDGCVFLTGIPSSEGSGHLKLDLHVLMPKRDRPVTLPLQLNLSPEVTGQPNSHARSLSHRAQIKVAASEEGLGILVLPGDIGFVGGNPMPPDFWFLPMETLREWIQAHGGPAVTRVVRLPVSGLEAVPAELRWGTSPFRVVQGPIAFLTTGQTTDQISGIIAVVALLWLVIPDGKWGKLGGRRRRGFLAAGIWLLMGFLAWLTF